MEIISNFHDDFVDVILKKVEHLKKFDFAFFEYGKWKTKKIRALNKIIAQKESRGENFVFERNMLEEEMLYNEYRMDIVHHYFNLSCRIPTKIPRKIYKCVDFFCPRELKAGLDLLQDKIIHGDDLLPNLSRQIFDPTYRDYMLYDFGIIHFHLGTNPSKKILYYLKVPRNWYMH
jgi:hypothetical protein